MAPARSSKCIPEAAEQALEKPSRTVSRNWDFAALAKESDSFSFFTDLKIPKANTLEDSK
jgi:hypothetical protein